MTFRLLTVILVFLAGPLQAGPAKVSATEQADLTRLLFEFDAPPGWDITRSGRGFALVFNGGLSDGFDLSRVFRSVSRSRIRDIRATGPNSVEIDLSCDCQIRVARNGNTGLFLDIVSQETDATAGTRPNMQQSQIDLELPEIAPSTHPMAPRTSGQSLPPLERDELFSAVNGFVQTEAAFTLGDLTVPKPNARQSLAVEMMGRAFSRAASQGLVTADSDIAAQALTIGPNVSVGMRDRSNLSVTTGFDRVVRPPIEALPPTESGAICLPDTAVDVAAWGRSGEKNLHGKLRAQMVAEDGSVDPDGALELARYYLFLGFGAEAIATATYVNDNRERQIVEAIAAIMDDGKTSSPVLAGQVYCEGIVALWGALSAPISPQNVPETPNYILSAFSALPPHLRSHLGPLLSERLRTSGMDSAARTALNAVTRGGKKTDESALATARLDLTGTRAEDARDTLEDLSNGTDLTRLKLLWSSCWMLKRAAWPRTPHGSRMRRPWLELWKARRSQRSSI